MRDGWVIINNNNAHNNCYYNSNNNSNHNNCYYKKENKITFGRSIPAGSTSTWQEFNTWLNDHEFFKFGSVTIIFDFIISNYKGYHDKRYNDKNASKRINLLINDAQKHDFRDRDNKSIDDFIKDAVDYQNELLKLDKIHPNVKKWKLDILNVLLGVAYTEKSLRSRDINDFFRAIQYFDNYTKGSSKKNSKLDNLIRLNLANINNEILPRREDVIEETMQNYEKLKDKIDKSGFWDKLKEKINNYIYKIQVLG